MNKKYESAARTRKLEAETDHIDKDFVDSMTGNKRARELEDKEIDYGIKKKEKEDDAGIEMTRADMMAKIKQLEAMINSGSENQTKTMEE